jgi:hypothetical protein
VEFGRNGVRPRVVGTFEVAARLEVFGHAGVGLVAMPSVNGTGLLQAVGAPLFRHDYAARNLELESAR